MASQKRKTRSNYRRSSRRRPSEPAWAKLREDDLLDLRLCDLGLKIEGSPLEHRIQQLYDELEIRDIRFRPHCWLSEEWFSPDGVPGIAIPFYLAHPRLTRLERKLMLEVEGGTKDTCMKILRHEAGHALDTTYRLHRRRRYRETFGAHTQRYPEFYQPKPFSKNYVLHLDLWYAQSHPVEDFAETFAVWLRPYSRWRTRYQGWPAMKKLQYVDELMTEVRSSPRKVRSRRQVDSLRTTRITLRQHYERKRDYYGVESPHVYDRELRRLFPETHLSDDSVPAAKFLRRLRPELRRVVAHWTGEYQYTIDQVLAEMISRSRDLKLRLDRSEEEATRDALVLLAVQTMNYLHAGHHRLAL